MNTSLLYYRGEIEVEKPFEQQGQWFRTEIYGGWFVLSENPDCTEYLRGLDTGAISSPSVVPKDSPAVNQWLEMDSPRSSAHTNTLAPSGSP